MCDRQIPHFLHDLLQSTACNGLCTRRGFAVALFKVCLVLDELVIARLNGLKLLNDGFAHGGLEITVAAALEFLFDFVIAVARNTALNAHQVIDAGFVFAVVDAGFTVRDSAFELFHDLRRGIEHSDEARRVFIGFAHLLRRVL